MKASILKTFAASQKMTVAKLEKVLGVSNGTIFHQIKGDKDISELVYNRLKQHYPDLSDEWLETEQGDMFVKKEPELEASGVVLQKLFELSDRVARLEVRLEEMAKELRKSSLVF